MPRWLQQLFDLLNRFFGNQNPSKPPNPPKPSDPPKPDPPLPSRPPTNSIARQLLNAHNHERSIRNVSKLRINPKLQAAAESHAKWMSDNEIISHRGSRGSSVGDRTKDEGHIAITIGENIARGYSTIESVMQGWMNSSGHRSNILRSQYIECGLTKIGRYWCVVFGTPAMVHDKKDHLGFEDYKPTEYAPEPLYNNE